MKTNAIIILFILILSGTLLSQSPDSVNIKLLPPAEFLAAFQKSENGRLIDVREFFEYRKSRIKDAINIPSSGDLEAAADSIDKNSELFFYCTSGFRSKRVAKFFYGNGFPNVCSLDGGITAWKKERMPVVKKRIRKHKD